MMIPQTIPPELQGVLESTPDTLSGSIRFRNTRVPLKALLDTFHAGEGVEEFLEGWPDVSRDDALVVLRWIHDYAVQGMSGVEQAS